MLSLPDVPHKYVKTVSDSVVVCGHTIGSQERLIKGLDDKVYESQRNIWEAVPRGHGVYTYDGATVALIAGLRKFGYIDAPYGNRAAATHAVFIEKENGECAHVTGFKTPSDGTRWWIAGSKHVHVAFPEGCDFADVEAAYSAERYKYAIKIARVWHRMLADLAHKDRIHERLATKHLTLCGEAILSDSEHIVAYDTKDIIKFYAVSDARPSAAGLTALDPEVAVELFRSWDLPHAQISRPYAIGSAEYKAALDAVARRSNSEGVVVYGMYDGVVCAMWKEKSYPYVMERVVREAIIGGKSIPAIRQRVATRLGDHAADLRAYFAEWEASRFPMLLRFAVWLRLAGHIPVKNGWDVQARWLTLQAEFATAMADAARVAEVDAALAAADKTSSGPTVVMFMGLPGSGKSTTARSLFWILKQAGYAPRWLNQDEADSNRRKYLEAIKTAMNDPDTTHILLDKSNLAPENRGDYAALGLKPDLTVLYGHGEGVEAYKAACYERFVARGAAHRSFRAAGEEAVGADKFATICDSMLSKYIEPADDTATLKVDVRSWPTMILSEVLARLDLEGDVEGALEFSRKYEAALASNPKLGRGGYGGIRIHPDALAPLFALVPAGVLDGKTLKKEFHVTTRYLGGIMDPVWYLEQLERVRADADVPVHITELVWNAACVAARVTGAFECDNAHPHITLALGDKTKGDYSNTLLGGAIEAESVAVDLTVLGKYFM